LRSLDSNQGPSGYEPDELPLLHSAPTIIPALAREARAEGGTYLKRPPRLASRFRLTSRSRSSLDLRNLESFSSKIGSAPSGRTLSRLPLRHLGDTAAGASRVCLSERSYLPLVGLTCSTLTRIGSFSFRWSRMSRTYS